MLQPGQKSEENIPSNEGITYEKGDQGVETGNPSSNNYDGDISHGLGNTGVGYDLEGRSLIGVPPIKDESQETGIVAVRIKVDRNGTTFGSPVAHAKKKKERQGMSSDKEDEHEPCGATGS